MEIERHLIKDVEYAEDFKDLKESLAKVFNDLTIQDCDCNEEIENLRLLHEKAVEEIENLRLLHEKDVEEIAYLNKRLNTLIGRLESSMSNLGEHDDE